MLSVMFTSKAFRSDAFPVSSLPGSPFFEHAKNVAANTNTNPNLFPAKRIIFFKLKMDPLKTLNKTLLTEIKTKQSTCDGILYHMANHDEGFMETYDGEGYLISTRRLRPDEKQGSIFSLAKASNQ